MSQQTSLAPNLIVHCVNQVCKEARKKLRKKSGSSRVGSADPSAMHTTGSAAGYWGSGGQTGIHPPPPPPQEHVAPDTTQHPDTTMEPLLPYDQIKVEEDSGKTYQVL